MTTDENGAGQDQRFRNLAEQKRTGLLREYMGFLRLTGKWWLLPILGMLALVGGLVILGGSGAAPFIYALF